MPVYQVTDPESGRKVRLTGESPPTDQELEQIFANLPAPQAAPVQQPTQRSLGQQIVGGAEVGGQMLSAIAAEPVAGLAGIGMSAPTANVPQATPEMAAMAPMAAMAMRGMPSGDVVRQSRQELTYQPRTESGQAYSQAVGETLAPIGEAFQGAEDYLGNKAFEATGSPAIAAAATAIPTAIAEALGIGLGRGATRLARRAEEAGVTSELRAAAPSIDELKSVSRDIYREIDEMGATVAAGPYQRLSTQISREAQKMGLDSDITPKSARTLQRIQEAGLQNIGLTDLDTLRNVAQGAARSIDAHDAAIGTMIINRIDDFIENSTPAMIRAPKGTDIGQRYKVARDLWGRARKSEVLQEAFERARNQASGFENGLRTQFRSILNNKRQRKFFKPAEISAMQEVVRGSKGQNIAKLIGKLGFSEGGSTNIVGGSIGAGAGAMIAGPAGAVAVPLIGQVSRNLAQRLTRASAEFADDVIRAGSDAKDITRAYIRNTPAAQRSAEELSQLLMRPDINLSINTSDELAQEAFRLAAQRRNELLSGAGGGSAASQEQ